MIRNGKKKAISCALVAAMSVGLAACGTTSYDFKVSYDGIKTGDVSSKVSVHDPSILKADGEYYIFGSHMSAAKSSDLLNWEKVADGYSKKNPVYGQIYDVADEAFAYSGSKNSLIMTDDKQVHVWAPDVIYNETTGLYYMYYCTTSTWNASNLCYGTSTTPEGPYEWQGALIYSGFNRKTISGTDVLDYVDEDYAYKNYIKGAQYNYEDYPNAIDPTVFYDADGRMWMVYGSWSGGIFCWKLTRQQDLLSILKQIKQTMWIRIMESVFWEAAIFRLRAHISCMMRQAVIIICLCRMEL